MSSGERPSMRAPSNVTFPARGRTVPATTLSKVDFPAPLGPVTNSVCPASSRSDTSRSAVSCP